ncbi:hypothetical protein ABWH96_10770 [Marivirga tractuosa]|uniref:hypothetical protein n=1 Tax=Marivirga tractuosa TaxID=1006 RepID=UPI0035CED1B3
MIKNISLLLLFSIFLFACQPDEKKNAQENESNKNKNSKPIPKVDIADIETGIKNYIDNKTKEADGYFHVKDENKELRLKLVRVHTEYLSNLGSESSFCLC